MQKREMPDTIDILDFHLWEKATRKNTLLALSLELTSRCNNNCPHCYINLPAEDKEALNNELSLDEIVGIVDQARAMGTLWILLSGGEPLLRKDFSAIYKYIKQKGFLVSLFTNGSLIGADHIDLFKKYPPRDIEVTVYGISKQIHQMVTRKNTFSATMKGIRMLARNSMPLTLKSTVTRSNHTELIKIAEFCRKLTEKQFRFDPFLHLRIDNDSKRNKLILSERLSPKEIIQIEKMDPDRVSALKNQCDAADSVLDDPGDCAKLFKCKAGITSCCISSDGFLKLCTALTNKRYTYNLRTGSLKDAWAHFVPSLRAKKSNSQIFKQNCGSCNLHDLCMWCPAHGDLEIGSMEEPVPLFCELAKKRNSIFHR